MTEMSGSESRSAMTRTVVRRTTRLPSTESRLVR
jgi:hypothetical protein